MRTLRWMRAQDGVLAGVAKGIARALDLEPWMIRVVFLAATAIGGLGILAYLIFLLALPPESAPERAESKMILGVCIAIHRRGDVEIGIARAVALCLFFASFGAAVVGYLVLYVLLKNESGQGD